MWPIRGDDDIVDDKFLRFVDYITEICELEDGQLGTGGIGQRARAIFGSPTSDSHLAFLFKAFDVLAAGQRVRPSFVRDTFEGVFSLDLPGTARYDPDKVVLFGSSSVKPLQECCAQFDSQSGGNRGVHLASRACSLRRAVAPDREDHRTSRVRVRILRNLLAGPRPVRDVYPPAEHARPPEGREETQCVDGDYDEGRLSLHQRQNERDTGEVSHRIPPPHPQSYSGSTDHPILRGALGSFELMPDNFQQRAEACRDSLLRPRAVG